MKLFLSLLTLALVLGASPQTHRLQAQSDVRFGTIEVDQVKVFYREAGQPSAPTVVLLHGYPSSSFMFRNLLVSLSKDYHVIAPDYPGFGFSDAPDPQKFTYSFDNLASVTESVLTQLKVTRFSMYVVDYGAPIGFRIAAKHPDWIQSIIVQNGIAHMEGVSEVLAKTFTPYWQNPNAETEKPLRDFLTLASTKLQYQAGVKNVQTIAPEAIALDQALLDRPGNADIQLKLFYDYRNNPAHFAEWQAYLRKYQPKLLVAWGKNDPFFTVAGAAAYQKDVPSAQVHLLDSGHFVLEDKGAEVAKLVLDFLHKSTK